MSTDPVCGMEVYEYGAPMAVYDGVIYHFCSKACLGAFEENPRVWVTTVA